MTPDRMHELITEIDAELGAHLERPQCCIIDNLRSGEICGKQANWILDGNPPGYRYDPDAQHPVCDFHHDNITLRFPILSKLIFRLRETEPLD